jgi:hypothetical protein
MMKQKMQATHTASLEPPDSHSATKCAASRISLALDEFPSDLAPAEEHWPKKLKGAFWLLIKITCGFCVPYTDPDANSAKVVTKSRQVMAK